MMKLRKMLYHVLCLVAGAGMLSGCIEEYEADISSNDTDLIVVEGTIRSSSVNTFILSRSTAANYSEMPPMITDATVSVRGSDGSEYTTQQYGGYYTCKMEALSPDVEYYLHIETDGEVYESEPQKPLPTEKIADIRGVQNTPGNNVDVLITPEEPFMADQARYYSWTYDETWEVRPDYTTRIYYDPEFQGPLEKLNQFPERGWIDGQGTTIMVGASTNYDGQHIQGLKLYDIDRSDRRLYYKYSGLVHQRAISKAEYEYELARRQAGSEMGGLFTPQPSALPTNIHCLTSHKRVIGFVGCSLNTSDYRFFLLAKDYDVNRSTYDAREWLINPTHDDCMKKLYEGRFLCEWISPQYSPDGLLHTAWATIYQLDIRYKYRGVYLEEPDYWFLNNNISY